MTSPDTEFISILDTSSQAAEPASRVSQTHIPETLPILGLSDIVFFPGMVAPLLVDTAESIKLIDDVVGGDRFLGLVLQKSPEISSPGPNDLWSHGCAARIMKMLKFPDNTVRILVEGLRRFSISSYETQAPYLRAKVELIKDAVDDSVELAAIARNAYDRFQEIIKLTPALAEQTKAASFSPSEPGKLSDLIACNVNIELTDRQQLLEINQVKDRLVKLLPLLAREVEVLTLGSKIQSDVANSMSKSQRDFFLREQLRAVQRELGDTDPSTSEINQLREQLEQINLPEDARKTALKELDRLQQIPPSVAEYTVTRNYVDWILALPWDKTTEDKFDLVQAAKLLDEQHYGLGKVKDRLLEFLAILKLKQQIKGPILCLVGPPGVGKTSLGKSVADALGRKFARIALGGMRDEAEIRGHRRTYVGAMPGRILQCLKRVESRNPVILLDEIDKVGADYRGDPAAALLEVLDPQQNHTFTDNYLDLPFDLSRVLFITTANWMDPIHPALRDRMEVINLPSYTMEEKLAIALRYLVPRQIEEHGLNRKQVKIPAATLRQLIENYTHEAGVRNLEREIASLVRKSARKIITANGHLPAVVIEPVDLTDFLGQARFIADKAEKITTCGIATGLAWTPVGGDILFIEATRMPGAGRLTLTGSLGDVMKESAQTALSYLRSQAQRLGLDLSDHDKHDLHIHVPAGATPKDGPSAGVTVVAALASLISHRKVRTGVAMTGEISLRGRILRVGGIKEKVLAAARSGLKEVILPEQNRSDWNEVPEEVRARMKSHFVKEIDELLQVALEPLQKIPAPKVRRNAKTKRSK
jgi:ATP-dependent Lon protease